MKSINGAPKRIITAALFALVFLSLVSCSLSEWFKKELDSGDEQQIDTGDSGKDYSVSFTLARYTGETLHPYISKSRTNRDLLTLCYDPLIYVDNKGNAIPVICSEYVMEEKSVLFRLRNDVRFSDGTSLTAADCVYSYDKASSDNSVYKDRFKVITGYEAVSDYEFRIYFNTDSVYNVNLADIPIIKNGTSGDTIPTGSGKYIISRDNTSVVLIKNSYTIFDTGENFELDTIKIHDIQGTEELLYNFNYNKIHGSYTDITDEGSEFRGNIETISFCDNSIVFAVINVAEGGLFAEPLFAKGVTYAINRSVICSGILSGGTQPVWYPFNPDWSVTVEAALNRDIYSASEAHGYFNNAGAVLSGTVRTYGEKEVFIRIIVNSENLIKEKVADAIAADLVNMGFSAVVESLNWDEYCEAVTSGDYDIYIAEAVIPMNMDISSLLSGSVNTGEKTLSDEFYEALAGFNAGAVGMRDFLSIFQEELPFIPLYFNRGALAVNRMVSGDFSPSNDNLYSGIENWEFS